MSKKHYKDFTKDEVLLIKQQISVLRQHDFSKHTEERMIEKNITESDIFKIFKHYHIIEYYNKNGDLRVLLRGELKEESKCTCVSMSLKTGIIITVYQNDYNDIHKTIRWEEYNKNIDIVKEFNTYIGSKTENRNVI